MNPARVVPDLGGLALLGLALASLLVVRAVVDGAFAPLHSIGAFGFYPFRNIANAVSNAIIGVLDDAIKGVEKGIAWFFNDLTQTLELGFALAALLGAGTVAAFKYLWNHGIPTYVTAALNPFSLLIDKAESLARQGIADAAGAVARAVERAATYTDRRAESALAAARGEIAAALTGAERYADYAVGQLRAAEDAALSEAVGIAVESKVAAERYAEGLVAGAEANAASLVHGAEAGFTAALDTVRSIAITAEHDLATIEGNVGALGVAGLIASIPALATLVHAIATEAGLESAECRGKVGRVCSTDPSAWANLLGGLAALGLAFSLRELAAIAKPLAHDLAPIINQAA